MVAFKLLLLGGAGLGLWKDGTAAALGCGRLVVDAGVGVTAGFFQVRFGEDGGGGTLGGAALCALAM